MAMRLGQLDAVLATACRMAFRLERSTSTEAALVLAGVLPVRFQILRRLCLYMARRDWRALSDPSHPPIPPYYVSA